jgi:meromycolic acid enoyl-[acyl-carrier-protein] reductase
MEANVSGLLAGKRLLITGIITDQSIAFATARLAIEQGATVVLTGFGRLSLVERIARRLPAQVPVIELDVTNQEHLAGLAERVSSTVDGLDGVVHSIAFAPQSCLGGGFLDAPWEDVATALHVSTYSYKSLAVACLPLMKPGGAVVGLTFDATKAWPVYDWMGVAKAGLESANRYLALHLGRRGIRANLVSAGPLRTVAAKSIPGFDQFEDSWQERAPLGWNLSDQEPAARAVLALLSDWFPATTGEIVHVDGGYHALGA